MLQLHPEVIAEVEAAEPQVEVVAEAPKADEAV